jgi:hypothetical protein
MSTILCCSLFASFVRDVALAARGSSVASPRECWLSTPAREGLTEITDRKNREINPPMQGLCSA